MLIRHRSYLLKDSKKPCKAHIEVIPTGSIQVTFHGQCQCHVAEFDNIMFERNGKLTHLIAKNNDCDKSDHWKLVLTCDDAKELEHLIEEASEELEILMRDLM